MFREITPEELINLVSAYCSIYNVPITELVLPSVRNKIPGTKLHAVLQSIQSQWVSTVLGHPCSADAFISLAFAISDWIEQLPEDEGCGKDSDYDIWWAMQWKRAAEMMLGLNIKKEAA